MRGKNGKFSISRDNRIRKLSALCSDLCFNCDRLLASFIEKLLDGKLNSVLVESLVNCF